MRQVKVTTYPQRNKVPTVTIDNYGTMTMLNFVQKLWQNDRVSYTLFVSAHKIALTDGLATNLLNENLDLFPPEF